MEHGHPLGVDDTILESSNRNAKRGKELLFWGGTDEADDDNGCHPDGTKRRKTWKQQRAVKGRGDEEYDYSEVRKEANESVVVQRMKNDKLEQQLRQQRGWAKKGKKAEHMDAARDDAQVRQRDLVIDELSGLSNLAEAAAEARAAESPEA